VSTLALDISISLDGYATGANPSDDAPMGIGGERLHAWALGDDPVGSAILDESNGRVGATIAGHRTYDRSVADWGANGPGGDDRTPTFIVSHTVPSDVPAGGVYTFRPDPEAGVAAAREAAGDRPIDVFSPSIGRHLLRAGLVDELRLHVNPIVLGGGILLLEDAGPLTLELLNARPSTQLRRCTCTTRSGRQHEGHIPRRRHGCPRVRRPPSPRRASGDAAKRGRRARAVARRGIRGVMGAPACLTYRDVDAAVVFLQRRIRRRSRGGPRHPPSLLGPAKP